MYAVASRTYAFYSCNMIMYGGILSFGSAATVYDAIAQPTKSNWKKLSSVMLVALGVCAESEVLLAQM